MVEQPNINPAAAVNNLASVGLNNNNNISSRSSSPQNLTGNSLDATGSTTLPLKNLTRDDATTAATVGTLAETAAMVSVDQVKLNMSGLLADTTANSNPNPNNNDQINKLESESLHSRQHEHHRSKRRNKWCDVKKINRKAIKRPIPCLFAFTLLISATGSYYSLVAPELLRLIDEYHWFALVSIQSALFMFALVNFVIAVIIDPGRFQKFVIAPDDPNFNDDTKSPLYKTIQIKEIAVKIKWCSVSFFLL